MRMISFSRRATTLLMTVLFLSTLTSPRIWAHESQGHSDSKAITITGEVIDPNCFLIHGARGIDHKACAEMCAKAGTTLAILDEKTNTLYIPIAVEHAKNPNEKALPFAGERVTVTGQAVVKYGYHAIAIKSVTVRRQRNNQPRSWYSGVENL
jgi:hypothetical protein